MRSARQFRMEAHHVDILRGIPELCDAGDR
jgi:hypothetical protein